MLRRRSSRIPFSNKDCTAWHQSLCTHFVRDAVAFRFINLKHVATDKQFADVFTKPPSAPMLLLLHTLMNGTAPAPLVARLYQ